MLAKQQGGQVKFHPYEKKEGGGGVGKSCSYAEGFLRLF